jgi:NAD(P)-dependent dehydrogenase (short-subunit alcohol dehydrogenase family)
MDARAVEEFLYRCVPSEPKTAPDRERPSVRSAAVTGAARGLGLVIARKLAIQGWSVVLLGRDDAALSRAASTIEGDGGVVGWARCDVTDEASVQTGMERATGQFGSLDLLVNNAGIPGPTVPTWQLARSDWDEVLAVQLTGPMLCCKAVLPGMIERRSGHIVNVSSIAGKRPLKNRAAFAASKLGLVGLTRTLAEEVGEFGIRVNSISPGLVEGDRLDRQLTLMARARNDAVEIIRDEFRSSTPLRRTVTPDEVADAVLALDAMTAVTGVDLNVAAGLVMY